MRGFYVLLSGPFTVTVRSLTSAVEPISLTDGSNKKQYRVRPAGSTEEEPSCGRPLGIRVGPNGTLFVADAYLGVFEVNPTTGESAASVFT